MSEIKHEPLPDRIGPILEASDLESILQRILPEPKKISARTKAIEDYLKKGGLPGACFVRETKSRNNLILDQIQTILDRDIRLIYPTNLSYQQILDFFRTLASTQGKPIHWNTIRRETGLTPNTQKKLLEALESVFLIRRLPIEGTVAGFTLLLEDQGESDFFSQGKLDLLDQHIHLFYRNIRAEFFYRFEREVQFFQYRTRSGVIIPLALRGRNAELGFIPIAGDRPTARNLAAAQSFLKTYRGSRVIFIGSGRDFLLLNSRTAIIPLGALV